MTWRISSDCPSCGGPLRLCRNRSERSLFVGCARYPRCRFAEDYDAREADLVERILELEAALDHYVERRPSAPAEVVEKELLSLIFEFHPDRQHAPIPPHVVVRELTRLRDRVRGAA